jgi:hypothetical protein
VLRTTVQGGSIQVDDLKSGMYLLRVMGDDRTIQGRFIKQSHGRPTRPRVDDQRGAASYRDVHRA